jgi:hypothetical protein
MKNLLILVIVTGLAFISCKKARTCDCELSSNFPGMPVYPTVNPTPKLSKKDAEKYCDKQDYSYTETDSTSGFSITFQYDCELRD